MEALITQALSGDWKTVTLTLVLIGLNYMTVRLTKADGKFLPDLQARWRPVLSVSLGILYGAGTMLAAGTPWRVALIRAAAVGLGPIALHIVGSDVLADGKDLPLPASLAKPEPLSLVQLAAMTMRDAAAPSANGQGDPS